MSEFDDFMAQVFDDVVNGGSGEWPRDLRQTDPNPDCVLCRRGERHSEHRIAVGDIGDADVSLKEPLTIEFVLRPEDLRDPIAPDLNMAGEPFDEPGGE